VSGIEVSGLVKTYGSARAVDRLSFVCPAGSVTGLLGPNGSGKSTTMRMMLGFARPDAGTATFDGVRYVELPNPGRVVGALLYASAQHAGRGTRETLRLSAAVMGLSARRADECLELVGLASVARKRVGGLSLGMRQRLGIAQALLGSPRFLVLDEPLNGLDPEGIGWVRTLVRHVAAAGGTVLVSSHLLREVQAVADWVVIVDRGRLVSAGPLHEVAATTPFSRVRSADDAALSAALVAHGSAVHAAPGGGLVVEAPARVVGQVALAAGVPLLALADDDEAGLESLFLARTTGEFVSGDAAALVGGAR
jgi:ABC-2 type transport system ATP-binding protein